MNIFEVSTDADRAAYIIATLDGRVETVLHNFPREEAERSASGYPSGRLLFEVGSADGFRPGMSVVGLIAPATLFAPTHEDPNAPENQPRVVAAWKAWQAEASRERQYDHNATERARGRYYAELEVAREEQEEALT